MPTCDKEHVFCFVGILYVMGAKKAEMFLVLVYGRFVDAAAPKQGLIGRFFAYDLFRELGQYDETKA